MDSKTWSKLHNHVIPSSVDVIASYSANAEERDIVDCFFDYQEIGEPPSKCNNL